MPVSVNSDHCDVYLCNRPIEGGQSTFASRFLSFFSSSSSGSLCGDSWNKHWLLVFDYGDEEVLICDANRDPAGDLTGQRSWKKKAALEATNLKKIHLGRHRVPEWILDKILKTMCDSGRYHATSNNCQTWALRLLKELGIRAPKKEYDAGKFVKNVIIPSAVAIGATAVGGVSVLRAIG